MDNKLKVLEEPWYKNGAPFQCTSFGKCCSGSPGYVWVSDDEILEMAKFLNTPIDLFKRKYLRQKGGKYALIELSKRNFDCIFLDGKLCKVYPVRPKQCKTYPFWPHMMKTKKGYLENSKYCEGINEDSPLVDYETIKKSLD